MEHIFLDESGDLGFRRSDYFIIAALCTKKPKPIYNCIKRIKKSTKNRYYKNQELHFSESEKKIRRRVLECLSNKDIRVSYILMNKSNFKKDPSIKSGIYKDALFMHLISETIKSFNIQGHPTIIIDRYLSGKSVNNFNMVFSKIVNKNKIKMSIRKDMKIEHMHSYQNKGLQAADFIAGVIHLRYRDNNHDLYKIISSKIENRITFNEI